MRGQLVAAAGELRLLLEQLVALRLPLLLGADPVLGRSNVTIEVGTDTIEVAASEATGEERDRLFCTQAERIPQFAEYEKQTDRVIPVIVLTPTKTG